MAELRDGYFKKDTQFRSFENMYKDFNPEIHPQVKGIDKLMAAGLWSLAVVLLVVMFYVEFIIFQLALYNLILGVVMAVYWLKALRAVRSVIRHKLDKGRKKEFQDYWQNVASQEWAKDSIKVFAPSHGAWVEVDLTHARHNQDEDVSEHDLDSASDELIEEVLS